VSDDGPALFLSIFPPGRKRWPLCRNPHQEVEFLRVRNKELDIARNLKMIDWLKAELIDAVAELFKSLLKAGNEAVCDALATIMILSYLLGQRAGVSFASIDQRVRNKLHISLEDSLGGEDWQDNLSELLVYLEKTKR